MIGSATKQTLLQQYREWIDRDFFGFARSPAESQITSVQSFIHVMSVGPVALMELGLDGSTTFPDISDLNEPLRSLLEKSVRLPTGDMLSFRSLFLRSLCREAVSSLIECLVFEPPEEEQQRAIVAECGVTEWGDIAATLTSEKNAHEIAMLLEKELMERVADRPMMSFFIKEPAKTGFAIWDPELDTGIGTALKKHTIDTPCGPVQVIVHRYEEDEEDIPVTAYEWCAKLIQPGATEPEAVACGMVYILEREDGMPVAGKQDLLESADQVADTDILQMSSFFEQHGDANEIIADSDLCFVWIWERRGDAQKGSGAECLKAALQDLQKRFKRVKTAILDTLPGQFKSWEFESDPPMVQVAKQRAIEQLVSYVAQLEIPRYAIKHIFNHHDNDPFQAMAALARGYMDNERHPSDDGSDPDPDELSDFFEAAGLSEMANRALDDEATDVEIHNVLRHALLIQRIPYLPVSIASASVSPKTPNPKLPIEQAMNDDDVCAFMRWLPDYASVEWAYFIKDAANEKGGRWIIRVTANTRYGPVSEFFTTVPVPRNIDATRFLTD